MDADKIKLDIENRISIIDDSIDKYYWRNYFKDKLFGVELEQLEKISKRVSSTFKFYKVVSIVLITLIIVLSLVTILNDQKNDFVNMNKIGLFLFMSIVFLINTFRYYKLKVNLENKIYLIKLWDMVDGGEICTSWSPFGRQIPTFAVLVFALYQHCKC